MTNGGVNITVDASDLRKVAKIARQFSPALARELRVKLKAAGEIGASTARDGIQQMPARSAPSSGDSLRSLIAKAIKVSVRTAGTGADVRIQAVKTPALIAYGAPGLAKAINKGSWRHPLFGDRDHWYTQTGYDFFDDRIVRKQPEMQLLVQQALEEAAAAAVRDVL